MLLLLTGCAWIGSQKHEENLERWSIEVEAVEGDLDRCGPLLEVRASLSAQRAGTVASVEVMLEDQRATAEAIVAQDGSIRWSVGPLDEVPAGDLTYQLIIDETTLPWTSAFTSPIRYIDADGDGFGDEPIDTCDPTETAELDGDCDDMNPAVNPGADELCTDNVDEDCDGDPTHGAVDRPTWYSDSDGDQVGDDATAVQSCDAPAGTVATGGDCDDHDDTVLGPTTWAPDVDADGLGDMDPSSWQTTCDDLSATLVADTSDCDDQSSSIGDTVFVDTDQDGFGDEEILGCPGVGVSLVGGDCDDHASDVHPDADELCTDNVDENCDGYNQLNATDATTWFSDGDGDGVGDPDVAMSACVQPPHYVDNADDCDDADADAYPAGTEICDARDNDCDGVIDQGQVGFWVGTTSYTHLTTALANVSDGDTLYVCDDAAWPDADALDNLNLHLVSAGHTINGSLRVDAADLTFEGLNLVGGLGTQGNDMEFEGGVLRADHSTIRYVDSILSCIPMQQLHRGGALQIYRSTLELDGTTIQDCHADRGGAVDLQEAILRTSGSTSTLTRNSAMYGGGIHGTTGTPANEVDVPAGTLVVENNEATLFGGGAYLYNTIGTLDATWMSNTGNNDSGGAFVFGANTNLEIGGTFDSNVTGGRGGGLFIDTAAQVVVVDATFASNLAGTFGGAIYQDATVEVTIQHAMFRENHATEGGGAVYLSTGAAITDTTFSANTAGMAPYDDAHYGGAIAAFIDIPLQIAGSTFTHNESGRGGAIFVAPPNPSNPSEPPFLLLIADTRLEHNTATVRGGAILAAGIDVEVLGPTTFTTNSTDGDGGGLAMIENAADPGGQCGALTGQGMLTFETNHAGMNGGGLSASTPSSVTSGSCTIDLTGDVTFVGNTADGQGAALELLGYTSANSASDATFARLDLLGNISVPTDGGAIRLHDGTFSCSPCVLQPLQPNQPNLVSITNDHHATYAAPTLLTTFDYVCDGSASPPGGCNASMFAP